MKAARRSILHIALDPFFVSVERRADPSLRGRPVIIEAGAFVAAASGEARAAGVNAGQGVAVARRLCPEAVFRPGDLDAYARASEEVTSALLAASRRVERPSADEAFVDLTPETGASPHPAAAAEAIKDDLQRRIGVDASLGLASSRLAARVASAWARPRGMLIVLPGYESRFLAHQSLASLPDLPPHLERALTEAGLATLGDVSEAEPDALAALVGRSAAARLAAAARAEDEEPVAIASAPAWVQEETAIRDRSSDLPILRSVLEGLVGRACRRLRPFGLAAGSLTIEVRRAEGDARRSRNLDPAVGDEATLAGLALALAGPLLEPARSARGLHVRLGRLAPPSRQAPLFPGLAGAGGRRTL